MTPARTPRNEAMLFKNDVHSVSVPLGGDPFGFPEALDILVDLLAPVIVEPAVSEPSLVVAVSPVLRVSAITDYYARVEGIYFRRLSVLAATGREIYANEN